MYVGRNHTATLEITLIRPFTCVHCRFQSVAKVRSRGVGQGTSPFMLREEGAREAARSEAEQKAEANADVLASLGFCPACDKQDGAALSSVKSGAYGKGLGFGVLAAVVCWFVFALKTHADGGVMGMIAIGAALITAIATIHTDAWKWNEVGQRVEVLRQDEVDALIAKLDAA